MDHSRPGAEDMAADTKLDPAGENTPSSIDSSPEPEAGAEASQEPVQPQKRKGGRKPIYATSEERKQRNRQAQAAFRERRTEYIKQLEATIKQNEDTLTTLQQSHRTAADECLMLRYKNSLLERILLEKGIDVQAELALKTGSPTLSFQHPGANIPQIPAQPQLQRTAMQRQHARRSGQFLPKLAPGSSTSDSAVQRGSPARPTPSSHASSPSAMSVKSPMVMQAGVGTPPTSAGLGQPQQQQLPAFPRVAQPQSQFLQLSPSLQRPGAPPHFHSTQSVHSSMSTGSRQSIGTPMSAGLVNPGGEQPTSQQLYADPFHKHMNRLEQEYDAQQSRSMLDPSDPEDLSNPAQSRLQGRYPQSYDQQAPQPGDYFPHGMSMPPDQQQMTTQQQQQMQATGHGHPLDGQIPTMEEMIDPNDPMLDADPFGLSASMHYPTSYSFEQAPQR
ncbi:hypothetical protein BDY17DRAFT_295230 [Neohortaea acidophila]|uniref:BZIP domain-containing protein n=1 Tax=Neohortaea acidophila TaxID=245834 RepID=A0A6A6PW08_9PEZI|nr:uncharacterized protein BDY17DRAFT_295230 [Neohortaea acidophila]KAF2484222.1 hypothetical protein BDY17DRAFT_295230 [Neohortaea acidophila]